MLELCVHIPSELLGGRLRVVELLLGCALERFKLVLKHSEVLLSVASRTNCLCNVRVHLGRLHRDGDHYEKDG